MRRLFAIQWGMIGAAVVIIVLLGFVRTSPKEGNRPLQVNTESTVSLDRLVQDSRKLLNASAQQKLSIIEGSIEPERDYAKRGQLYDSAIVIAKEAKAYVLAAWFAEQKAIKDNGSAVDWQMAGERYRQSVSFLKDEKNSGALYEAAIRCFNKALELDPKDAEAKIGLGVCIVESTGDPMKGVGLLLEVEKQDSTNVDVQLALGDLAYQSRQLDKAAARFNKALRLRPDLSAIHLSLADIYQEMGDTATAIMHLEEYVKVENDPDTKNDIENAISRLRSHAQKP